MTQESINQAVRDSLAGNNRISQRGLAKICSISQPTISYYVKENRKKSSKLAKMLIEHGFNLSELTKNGFNGKATWLVINYFSIISRGRNIEVERIYRTFLNKPYPNYFDILESESNYNIDTKVYIIHSKEANCVKIGISSNPIDRLRTLQTGFPYKLEIIKIVESENAWELEKSLHKALDVFHLRGEWFSDDCLALIDLTD